jgi:hypothetical protein
LLAGQLSPASFLVVLDPAEHLRYRLMGVTTGAQLARTPTIRDVFFASAGITTGVFALVGVTLGVVLGGGLDMARERARDAGLVKQAKRLVSEELMIACTNIDHFVSSGGFPSTMGSGDAALFPRSMWREHRATFARRLSDKQFLLLSRVFMGIAFLEQAMAEGAPLTPAAPELVNDATRQQKAIAFAYKHLTGKDWDDFLRAAPARSKGVQEQG